MFRLLPLPESPPDRARVLQGVLPDEEAVDRVLQFERDLLQRDPRVPAAKLAAASLSFAQKMAGMLLAVFVFQLFLWLVNVENESNGVHPSLGHLLVSRFISGFLQGAMAGCFVISDDPPIGSEGQVGWVVNALVYGFGGVAVEKADIHFWGIPDCHETGGWRWNLYRASIAGSTARLFYKGILIRRARHVEAFRAFIRERAHRRRPHQE
jgi:hypothetical protein